MNDRPYPIGVVYQEAPCFRMGFDDRLIGVPELVTEFVAARVIPDGFHRVWFRRIRRERGQGDGSIARGRRTPLLTRYFLVVALAYVFVQIVW
jgi:hypothetical protein